MFISLLECYACFLFKKKTPGNIVKNAKGHCSLGAAPVLGGGDSSGTRSSPSFPEMPGMLAQEGEAIVTTQDEN